MPRLSRRRPPRCCPNLGDSQDDAFTVEPPGGQRSPPASPSQAAVGLRQGRRGQLGDEVFHVVKSLPAGVVASRV